MCSLHLYCFLALTHTNTQSHEHTSRRPPDAHSEAGGAGGPFGTTAPTKRNPVQRTFTQTIHSAAGRASVSVAVASRLAGLPSSSVVCARPVVVLGPAEPPARRSDDDVAKLVAAQPQQAGLDA